MKPENNLPPEPLFKTGDKVGVHLVHAIDRHHEDLFHLPGTLLAFDPSGILMKVDGLPVFIPMSNVAALEVLS